MTSEMCNYDYHEILISGGMIYENRESSIETMLKSSFKMKISNYPQIFCLSYPFF